MFDGLHRGHQAVLESALRAARKDGGIAAILTFWPHPSRLLRPHAPTLLVQSREDKVAALAAMGFATTLVQPFTREFAAIEATQFLPHLREQLPTLQSVHVGTNFRFGHRRQGDCTLLESAGAALGVTVHPLPPTLHLGEPISSTRLRAALSVGDLHLANDLLGRPYLAHGIVQGGQQLGRRIGFPTLNLAWQPELQPAFGVYAVKVRTESVFREEQSRETGSAKLGSTEVVSDESRPESYLGVANYGLRPTVADASEEEPLLEVHLLHRPERLPQEGDALKVDFHHYLRTEKKFPHLDALKQQIAEDVRKAESVLAR